MDFHEWSVGPLILLLACGFLVFGGDACRSMLRFELVQSGPVYREGGGVGKASASVRQKRISTIAQICAGFRLLKSKSLGLHLVVRKTASMASPKPGLRDDRL
jgi:hypothetical protein